jgi:hypothetical protein
LFVHRYTWAVVDVFIYPVGIVFLFASILWYFDVPMMAKQKRKTVALKAVVAHLCQHVPDASMLFEEPLRILDKKQSECILRYHWKSYSDHKTAGSTVKTIMKGTASDNFRHAAEKAATTVLSAATATQDAVLHSVGAPPSPAVGPPVGIPSTNTPARPLVAIPSNQPESHSPVNTQESVTLSGGSLGNDDIEETEQQPSDAGSDGGGGDQYDSTTEANSTQANGHTNAQALAQVEDSDEEAEEDDYAFMTDSQLRAAVSELVDELVKNVSDTCCK